MTVTMEDLQSLAARANAGDEEALRQILHPEERAGRIMPLWQDCTRYPDGYRLGRNYLPSALWDAFDAGVLSDPAEVAKGVAESWVMCEYPLLTLEAPLWEMLFAYTGFVSDTGTSGHGQELHAPPVLYRSAHPDYLPGMSWTTELQTAWWFAERNRRFGHLHEHDPAVVKVDTTKHPGWVPLAAFSGRDEHEWVMPFDASIAYESISFAELDDIADQWEMEP